VHHHSLARTILVAGCESVNVLLVTIDTLRADHLECYGYGRETSPTLARLAEESVLFESCFAPAIPTAPALTSLFTSVDAYGHRIVNVAGRATLAPSFKTLPQVLQRHGCYTAAVGERHKPWFAWGYHEHVGHTEAIDREKRVKRFMEAVNRAAFPVLDGLARRKQWFFWVYPEDTHAPYWPPKPYDRMFYEGDERDPGNLSLTPAYAFEGFAGAYRGWFPEGVTDVEYIVGLYDGEIRYNSVHLARLFDRLKDLGLWEQTLIIVTADHGEILNDHAGWFDHHGLYEGIIRIPLLMRFPRAKYGGRRIGALVSNVDIGPTILDVLGLPKPRQFEGRSLMPLIRGEREERYRELHLGESTYQCKRGIRTREWKLIRALSDSPRHNWHGEGRVELYNLARDPTERTNVVHMWPSVRRELEARLDAWLDWQKRKWGHDDPIRRQGTSIGRRMLAAQLERDAEREWKVR
jgi:arylsulfatase